MEKLTVKAPAKINLYLDVVGRRNDGYHDILSIMQTVSLCDEIELALTDHGIKLDCGDSSLTSGESNLAYRAARLFLDYTGADVGVDMRLTKRIPMQAGLGGGSSDAAAVLRGLNRLCGRPLDAEKLCRLGAKLGADVPFCVIGGCACVGGIGERVEPLPVTPQCTVVICCPTERISTPWAYGELDRVYGGFRGERQDGGRFQNMRRALDTSQTENFCKFTYNIFEDVTVGSGDIHSIRLAMREHGAACAMLSGSGPSVFGIFDNERQARLCAGALAASWDAVHVCVPTAANDI